MTLWGGRRVPVTLLGGYLGAGKTTVVNHLLGNAGGRRIAVLVNDLGSVQVDAALVGEVHDDTIELTNGCVCCSLVDGFAVALEQLRQRPAPPDHVVIELSGVAEPHRVVPWTSTAGFRLDAVVVVADADQIVERAGDDRLADLVDAQLGSADLVLITKADLVGPADVTARLGWIADRTDAPHLLVHDGAVDPSVLLGVLRPDRGGAPNDGGSPRVDHPHAVAVVARGTPAALQRRLDRLPDDVVRAKGTVATSDGSRLVQCVGRRRRIDPWSGSADDRLVVIGLSTDAVDEAVRILEHPEDPTP